MIEILDCDQGSEAWLNARLGIPTASEFHTVLRQHGRKKTDPSLTRRKYMLTLIGERLTGRPSSNLNLRNFERGHAMEPDARKLYAFAKDVDVQQVGFIRNGDKGASPDGLVGDDGLVEFKSKEPHILLDIHLNGEIPSEHESQLYGGLWVAEREWIDFVAYWPGIEPFIRRVYRDEKRIKEIEFGVTVFLNELADLMEQIEQRQRVA